MSTETKVPSAGQRGNGDTGAAVLSPQTRSTAGGESGHTHPPASGKRRSLMGAFIFAYSMCAALVVYGIYDGGVWNILANTRILDVLIDSGLIAYTDQQMGLIEGLPDLELYLMSQQPIHQSVLLLVATIYTVYYLLKLVQFHAVARFYGLKGSFGAHVRAYVYGLGINRLIPYGGGDVALVSALVGQGEEEQKASSVVYVMDLFVWWEIISFTIIGVLLSGWRMTVWQMFWPCVFLGVLYYATRGLRHRQPEMLTPEYQNPTRRAIRAFATQPWLLTGLALLSMVCMLLDDSTPYFVSQALSSNELILHVPFLIVQGGVVGAYLATRIPITPCGIGQYEMGFGLALMGADVGFATSITIIMVDGLFRHGIALAMFFIMRVWHGVETNLKHVLDRFATEPAKAA
jgi:hypothetical protein